MKPIYNKLSSMPFIFGIARSQKWLVGRKQFLLLSKKSYHENVIDHYENPRNVGSLDKNKKNVGTGKFFYYLYDLLLLICY